VIKAILFDFDGTIADSFNTIIGIFCRLTGHEDILRKPDELERLRKMSLRKVGQELHIKPWQIPWLLAVGRRRMAHHMEQVALFEGMGTVIRHLHDEGYHLYIVSVGSRKNIRRFLKLHGLDECFVDVYGSASLFNKSKSLKRLLRKEHLAPDESIYIGDEVRDIEAAHRAGLPIVAVGWGFNHPSILHEHHPEALIDQPEQFTEILERYNRT